MRKNFLKLHSHCFFISFFIFFSKNPTPIFMLLWLPTKKYHEKPQPPVVFCIFIILQTIPPSLTQPVRLFSSAILLSLFLACYLPSPSRAAVSLRARWVVKGWGRPSRVRCFPSQGLPRAFLARRGKTSMKVLCLAFGELALFLALYKYVEICHLTSFLF